MKYSYTDQYGSRRGLIRTYWHQLLYRFGYYQQKDIDWNAVKRLVFICKGNICRSAYAEVVAKALNIETVSAGICAIENQPANERAIQVAKSLGHDLALHKTTPMMYTILTQADLVLAMEPWQIEFIDKHLEGYYQRALLGIWAEPAKAYIHDPYGLSVAYFENCLKLIEKSVNAIALKIKN